MKEKMVIVLESLLVLAPLLLLPGCCTGIGYVVGEALDNHNATLETIQVDNPPILETGLSVVVRTKDDSVFSGQLIDTRNSRLAEPQTRSSNREITRKDCPLSPQLGDTLRKAPYSGMRTITGNSIDSLMYSGALPVTTSLAIGVRGDTLIVPWDRIRNLSLIHVKTPLTGRAIGVLAGAAIDITALVITIENLSRTRVGGSHLFDPRIGL